MKKIKNSSASLKSLFLPCPHSFCKEQTVTDRKCATLVEKQRSDVIIIKWASCCVCFNMRPPTISLLKVQKTCGGRHCLKRLVFDFFLCAAEWQFFSFLSLIKLCTFLHKYEPQKLLLLKTINERIKNEFSASERNLIILLVPIKSLSAAHEWVSE